MDIQSINSLLENEWDLSTGFLRSLREGNFNRDSQERLVNILKAIKIEENTPVIDRHLVRLTWFIPLFMTWQIERMREEGRDTRDVTEAMHEILNLLYEILGVP